MPQQEIQENPQLTLQSATFADLPDWQNDDLKTFIPAFEKSCAKILKADATNTFGPLEQAGTYAKWQRLCYDFNQLDHSSTNALTHFFETNFTPYSVRAGDNPDGLFTGYYEASLRGSKTRHGPYQTPLYTRPEDLVMVQLGEFREELKGQRIAGRVIGGNLKPYESREQIVAGDWPHNDKVLVWVDDPVDAFFVQIQGSGIVQLDDGTALRIGYAGQNGHPYYAIGKELYKRGALAKDEISLQTIRNWLEQNPSQAAEIMNTNKSYVFFRELTEEGPIGGQGVALTAGRSLAIDRSLISYGLPVWTDIAAPVTGVAPIRRLMVTQDTGGAIRGPVRGDVFWGYGDTAEAMAGPMKSSGRYWVLLPK
ncbi:MAG: murein transglycosylase A [Bdellovibrionales bacterium]